MRILIFLSLMGLMAACKSDNSKVNTSPVTTEAAAPAPMAKKFTLTPFPDSYEFSDANMETMKYKAGKFNFKVSGNKYKLGQQTPDAPQKMCANSAKGQHIHLIVDNEPYAAKYEPTFDYDIADGDHYILAFLSRSYHESIKTPAAHKAVMTSVKGKSITATKDITEPMLFYSRPKGTYDGAADTKKVMLDFYPVNAPLGAGFKVQADINGEIHMIDKWQPYYIEGLPMGTNKITLTLLDGAGKTVKTPLNPVTRTFDLNADIPEN